LTINYSTVGLSLDTACDSYTWDGVVYTASGLYTSVYTNADGCDSTHTLDLTINYSTVGLSLDTACDSYTWDGVVYTASGLYTNVYTNADGCDSTHTLDLTINLTPNLPVVTQLFSTTLTTGVFYAYQWYRDGVLLTGETSQNLNFVPSRSLHSCCI
jgi:hypothetical protein